MVTKEIKTYSLSGMKDKYIGEVGTTERDEYEYELRKTDLKLMDFNSTKARKICFSAAKKTLLLIILSVITHTASAQSSRVEASLYGIQTGFLGIWGHVETGLTDKIALRTELGFDAGLRGGSFYSGTAVALIPVIRLEPRWYYNFDKRVSRSKRISNNSGNFLTVQTSFNPNWFILSNSDNVEVDDQISVIPTWGIRRGIGNNLIFEGGIGIGYRVIFDETTGGSRAEGETAANLHLRIGYSF